MHLTERDLQLPDAAADAVVAAAALPSLLSLLSDSDLDVQIDAMTMLASVCARHDAACEEVIATAAPTLLRHLASAAAEPELQQAASAALQRSRRAGVAEHLAGGIATLIAIAIDSQWRRQNRLQILADAGAVPVLVEAALCW